GRALHESGQQENAIDAWQRYTSEHPDGERWPEIQLQLARLTGDAATLRTLLKRDGSGEHAANAWVELAEHEARAGNSQLAIQHYTQFLERFPEDPGVAQGRYGLAWELRTAGDSQAALGQLSQLLQARTGPELTVAALELALWCASDLGQAQVAEDLWRSLLAESKNEEQHFATALVVSKAWQAKGSNEKAGRVLTQLSKRLKVPSVQLDLAIERLWSALDGKNLPSAGKFAREALQQAPADPRVLEASFFVGEACFAAGNFEQASEFYEQATHENNGELVDEALYKLGFSQLSLKQHKRAAQCFERLVADHEGSELFGESLYLAGESRYQAGDLGECVALLSRFRKQLPRHAARTKVLYRLGLAARTLREHKLASDALTELLNTAPRFDRRLEARYELGLALQGQGRPRAARAAFGAVLSAAEASSSETLFAARARLSLGQLDAEAGDLESALSQFLKVSLLYADGDEVREARLGAAEILEAQGKHAMAIKKFKELQASAPDSKQGTAAAKRLAELSSK
ncbi:MAG: tetratricopeptide (TPR) repeat protein, partial [Candidatus Paceibacteria bacterium]